MSGIEDPWSLVRLALGSLAGESWRVKQAMTPTWEGLKQTGDVMEKVLFFLNGMMLVEIYPRYFFK